MLSNKRNLDKIAHMSEDRINKIRNNDLITREKSMSTATIALYYGSHTI